MSSKTMAKARKPFVSRKKRKEMTQARERRESLLLEKQERATNDATVIVSGEKKQIELPESATVGEFSELLSVPVVRIITSLMRNGVMAAINDRIDFDTMAIIADEFGYIPALSTASENITTEVTPFEPSAALTEGQESRPPVVTIMGHVDHGKTSLLDKIRQTNVASGEVGGITQHIGAYQTEVTYEGKPRLITFLDTPGHEAFTALRSHGAQVTDIVILVVAADDGVKPQTIEALNHAKSAQVPIIVALTKSDLPSANPDRVKQQLTELGLIPEEWGGETVVVAVSSVTGEGIQELLEFILLTTDLKNFRADPTAPAQGVVIESHQETGLGPVATVLVQNGTLHIGEILVIGQTYGKIRSMMDYRGARIEAARPSAPVRIAGLAAIPDFGESFAVVKDERQARELTEKTETSQVRRGITDISQAIAEGRTDTLKIVLKADAQGSIEALRSAITKMQEPGVKPLIIHQAIGDITLNDIQLAAASQAVVFGFHVSVGSQIKRAAENLGVTVATFKIIYDLLEQIDLTLKGRIKTEMERVEQGRLKVKKIFRTSREAQIVGGDITQGKALDKAIVTINRDGQPVGEGKVISLQKGPEAVSELEAPQEGGLSIQTSAKIQEGDVLVFFTMEEVVASEISE